GGAVPCGPPVLSADKRLRQELGRGKSEKHCGGPSQVTEAHQCQQGDTDRDATKGRYRPLTAHCSPQRMPQFVKLSHDCRFIPTKDTRQEGREVPPLTLRQCEREQPGKSSRCCRDRLPGAVRENDNEQFMKFS